eukprot:TRINITY_DN1767_c0_g2_i4.p1 TRINITY_DN1767_c0_g2~~TRINITY_DN1767_c0_g2_i4.p1  ORF type:complete len:171 (-),score=12.99 TRINITY_DN1767_c0_g2_i4:46-558(-)
MSISEPNKATPSDPYTFSQDGKLVIGKSLNDQCGCYACDDIEKDEIIVNLRIKGGSSSTPSKYTIQISEGLHVVCDGPFSYINHSCEPNTYIDLATMSLRAVREIKKGSELSFNYLTTEWVVAQPFDCMCGSEMCVGRVEGFKYLNKVQRNAIQDILAPHLKFKDSVENS